MSALRPEGKGNWPKSLTCQLPKTKSENGETVAAPWPKDLLWVPGRDKGSRPEMGEVTKEAAAENGEVHMEVGKPDPEIQEEEEEGWGNKTQFLLACIGLAVGLGNVWRFPYLLHKNGGGAFLIPYVIMLIVEGLPVMYVEMAIGQYFRGGSVVSWSKIHPCLKGIGLCCVVISSFLCCYYVMVIAWVLYYLFVSLSTNPAYTNCDYTDDVCCDQDKTLYYWYAVVLKASPSIDDFGSGPSWQLVLFLIIAWIVTYLCVFQGVKSTGKAAYFAATFPYLCLFILLIRGVTLPGADIGLKALLKPDFKMLLKPNVWIEAATQIFFSLSLGFGALVAFASFMPYKNDITRDSMLVACVNCATSVLAGVCVYAILGFRSHIKGNDIDDVSAGTGLTFIAITEAIANFTSGTTFFALIFFFMLFNLGISSQFGTLAGLVTPLYNDLKLFGKARKELVVALLSLFFLIIGLIFTPGNGEYILGLFNNFPVTMPLLIVCITEVISVGWIFGIDNFDAAIIDMTGRPAPMYFKICIKYVSPFIMTGLLLWMLIDSFITVPKYTAFTNCNPDDLNHINTTATFTEDKDLPPWARVVGAGMVLMCVVPLIVFFIKDRPSVEDFKDMFHNRRVYNIGEAKKGVSVDLNDVTVNYTVTEDLKEQSNVYDSVE